MGTPIPADVRPTRIMAAANAGCLVTPASSDPMASLGICVFVPSELPSITRVDRSRILLKSRNGNIDDDTISDHVENDVIDNDSDSDGHPGIIGSSSEEELERLGSDSEDDIIDPIDFVGWRRDGWASLRVRRGSCIYKRKIDSADYHDLLKGEGRRGPVANKQSAKKEEFTIRENNNEPDANVMRTETLLPSPIKQSALQILQSLYHSLPVPPVGSTEPWLSGTDDGSRTGRGNDQDVLGNPSTPKPIISTSVDAMADNSFGSLRFER